MLVKNAVMEFFADDNAIIIYFSRNISKDRIEQFITNISDYAHNVFIEDFTQFERTVKIFLTKRLKSVDDAVEHIKSIVEEFNDKSTV